MCIYVILFSGSVVLCLVSQPAETSYSWSLLMAPATGSPVFKHSCITCKLQIPQTFALLILKRLNCCDMTARILSTLVVTHWRSYSVAFVLNLHYFAGVTGIISTRLVMWCTIPILLQMLFCSGIYVKSNINFCGLLVRHLLHILFSAGTSIRSNSCFL